jgi:predicted SAM-dependent methyltransferase
MDTEENDPVKQLRPQPCGVSDYSTSYLGQGKSFARLASYRMQLLYAARSELANALLIGKGDGLVVSLLRQAGIEVKVVDIDPQLAPDIVASVEKLPVSDKSYDVCICCQVLEHLPFEKFTSTLAEIRRVTRKRLVLSVPDVRRFFSLKLQLPLLKIDWSGSLPQLVPKRMPASRFEVHGHHWEIGFSGYRIARVRRAITAAGWEILEMRRVTDLPWHTFFSCRPHGA